MQRGSTGAGAGSSERLEAWIRGRVQGVGFRFFVARAAASMGLVGWVRNEPDGAVHVVAQGRTGDLDALVEALREGPPGADVDDVQVLRGPALAGLTSFDIRPGGHTGD